MLLALYEAQLLWLADKDYFTESPRNLPQETFPIM